MPNYVLVGPNAGKSGVWGGFVFKGGKCFVPPVDDVDSVYNILTGFYGAWPEDEAEAKQAEYAKYLGHKQPKPEASATSGEGVAPQENGNKKK